MTLTQQLSNTTIPKSGKTRDILKRIIAKELRATSDKLRLIELIKIKRKYEC